MLHLKATWQALASRHTDDVQRIAGLWTEIETQYTAPGRHYHNLTHLAYMTELAAAFRTDLEDYDLLLFSIFYHDIIYRPLRKDNERESAELARERLALFELPAETIDRCREQILATQSHRAAEDPDTRYLLDFDLAILGDSPAAYRNYARKIRLEYHMYPGFLYRKGRRQVVRAFLDRDYLFQTPPFREQREAQARENLRKELAEL